MPGQETRLHLPKPRPGAVQKKKKKLTIGEKLLWPCLIKVKSQPPKSRNHFYIAAFQKQDKEDFIFLVLIIILLLLFFTLQYCIDFAIHQNIQHLTKQN